MISLNYQLVRELQARVQLPPNVTHGVLVQRVIQVSLRFFPSIVIEILVSCRQQRNLCCDKLTGCRPDQSLELQYFYFSVHIYLLSRKLMKLIYCLKNYRK